MQQLVTPPRHSLAVDRANRLLKAVAASQEAPSLAQLARSCSLNRSTAWRLLATLERHGLVERDQVSQRYSLGYAVTTLAAAAADHAGLIRRARPFLKRLAEETRDTVNLSVATHTSVVCIDQVDSAQVVSINWVGRPLPLHCTSNGKMLLALLPEVELDAFLQQPLERHTPATITHPERLRRELDEVRKRGYALTVGEFEVGLNGVTAPILDELGRPVAFVSVSGPAYRVTEERLRELAEPVRKTAEEIGMRLR